MKLQKTPQGHWAALDDNGQTVALIEVRFGEWVARTRDRTLGICRSRETAEAVVRAWWASSRKAQRA